MDDKDQAEKQKAERDEPVSLAPLDPVEALKALLTSGTTDAEAKKD